MSAALVATDVVKRFGGLTAVDGLSVVLQPGAIVALIGPNGAGKTTFFNCLTGVLPVDAGRITLGDRELTRLGIHERARAGIGRTFQRLEVFTRMTVRENLLVAAEAANAKRVLRRLLAPTRGRNDTAHAVVDATIERLGLAWCADRRAGDLPTGVLRLVELGRSLSARPTMLLLDEPGSGLDEGETAHLRRLLRAIADDGIGILLIEHDVGLVRAISEYVYVIDFGRLLTEGTPDDVAADPEVQAAYLGVATADR